MKMANCCPQISKEQTNFISHFHMQPLAVAFFHPKKNKNLGKLVNHLQGPNQEIELAKCGGNLATFTIW